MPIFKQDGEGEFVPFERAPFDDLEQKLEDWIEHNPQMLLEDEDVAIIARQPRTAFDKYLDLLGIDQTGATVVIELKRGVTPRDVVAQALEYSAWVASLSLDQLDELARAYTVMHGGEPQGLADVYARTFAADEADEDGDDATERITFNNRQRLIIVAERISDEVEQTLRYLRTSYGVDVHGVAFSVHKSGTDTIISTTTVVGREGPRSGSSGATYTVYEKESDDQILARVQTEFMRNAVKGVEDWVTSLSVDGLGVSHGTRSRHHIRYGVDSWLFYQYRTSWLRMQLYSPTDAERAALRTGLSAPQEISETRRGHSRFSVSSDDDLEIVKRIILERLRAAGVPVPAAAG